MRNIRSSKPLVALLRVAILGITQCTATLIALLMWLLGFGVRALMCVMLAFAIAGIVAGDRATRPRR